VNDAIASASGIEVGWYDYHLGPLLAAADGLKWLFTVAAGVEHVPCALLHGRGIRASNGSGLNAANVADYAVLGVLAAAKRFDNVVRAHDRCEWLRTPPGQFELENSSALIVGYGAIGEAIGKRLAPFGVSVTGVRSRPNAAAGILGAQDWRHRIGNFDWILVAAPATPETKALISRAEFVAMKPGAWVINVARGSLIDREALLDALKARHIGGVVLDVTDPEPLPADDPLWKMPNAIITMHLAGRSETGLYNRAAALFVANLQRYVRGEPLENEIDLARGY
jgi:phosphoglycerate dehydrogenase-like enzyme